MPITLTVKVDPQKYGDRISTLALKSVDDAMTDWADKVFELSQNQVPADTGNLKRSGEILNQPFHKTITYHAPYALFVEYGTGIYGTGEGARHQPIRPVNAKALHWIKGGVDHFARVILGQHPQPFLRPAFDEACFHLEDYFRRNLERNSKNMH